MDGDGERGHADLGLVDAPGVATLADPVELLDEQFGNDDRVPGARREAGAQPGVDHRRIERGQDLAGARAVDRRPPGVCRIAQGSASLDAFDVDDVSARRHSDLDRLAERIAQLDQQRQAPVADRGALRRQPAVLHEAQPEAIPPVVGAVEQPASGENGTGAVGGALGDADTASHLADAELGLRGQDVDDVQRDPDRPQRIRGFPVTRGFRAGHPLSKPSVDA